MLYLGQNCKVLHFIEFKPLPFFPYPRQFQRFSLRCIYASRCDLSSPPTGRYLPSPFCFCVVILEQAAFAFVLIAVFLVVVLRAHQLPSTIMSAQLDIRRYNNLIIPMESNLFFSFEEFKRELHSWQKPLGKFLDSKVFQDIYKYVKAEYESGKKIYPKKEDIFNAFKVSPISSIKVVIVGQDPYHQPKQAHGLCFSVLKPVPPPPSLKNIYKNLSTNKEITFKMPNHGDLTKWAEQGVFLLNASLTVEDSKANSHAKCGWQKFTDQVISVINEQCNGVVFLLWGKPAQQKAKSVNPSKHHILKTSHPSPLSAHQGFLTSTCFSDCNKYLEKTGRTAINWNVD